MNGSEMLTPKEFVSAINNKYSLSRLYQLIENETIPHYRIHGKIFLKLSDFRCEPKKEETWEEN